MSIKPYLAFIATIIIIVLGLEVIQTWVISEVPFVIKLDLAESVEFAFGFFFGIILGYITTEIFYRFQKTIRINTPNFLLTKSIIQAFVITFFVFIICEIIFPMYVLKVSVVILFTESPISDYVIWYFTLYFIIFLLCIIVNIFFEVRRKFGAKTLKNFLLNKYTESVKEEYIYMFIDLKSSTEMCEQLGDVEYMQLIQDILVDISGPILETKGDIYQYIGDEIIIEWKPNINISLVNYVDCFFKINKIFYEKAEYYKEKYKILPKFHGALHIGNVVTGELGQLKVFIEHRGKALNVTKRILEFGKKNNFDLVVSESIYERLEDISKNLHCKRLESIRLKGIKNKMALYVAQQNGSVISSKVKTQKPK